MSQTYTSGIASAKLQSDCVVSFTPTDSGAPEIVLRSKVAALYGRSIRALAEKTLADLKIAHGKLEIEDAGALPFVISARIEAAVKMANPELNLESLPEREAHTQYHSSREKFRRSRLYLPGNQPKLMLNAGLHKPDGIILDLEDAVALAEKPSARLIVRNALRVLDFFGAEKMVRINQGARGGIAGD